MTEEDIDKIIELFEAYEKVRKEGKGKPKHIIVDGVFIDLEEHENEEKDNSN